MRAPRTLTSLNTTRINFEEDRPRKAPKRLVSTGTQSESKSLTFNAALSFLRLRLYIKKTASCSVTLPALCVNILHRHFQAMIVLGDVASPVHTSLCCAEVRHRHKLPPERVRECPGGSRPAMAQAGKDSPPHPHTSIHSKWSV